MTLTKQELTARKELAKSLLIEYGYDAKTEMAAEPIDRLGVNFSVQVMAELINRGISKQSAITATGKALRELRKEN